MEVKLFELRDEGTHIDIIAIKPLARDMREMYLLGHAGYGVTLTDQSKYVLLGYLHGGQLLHYNAYKWDDVRTMSVAHSYIIKAWDELVSGQVIDVRVILGETTEPAESDEFYLVGK